MPAPDPAPAASAFDRAAIEAIRDPFARLRVIMQRLLDPGGCPWDREQTHESLRQYLIEEAYEAAEAIDRGDRGALCEELGDVALQVVFHAELAERAGTFRLEDVYDAICTKLLDRHPHVFGSAHAPDAAAVLHNWERLKRDERDRKNGNEEPASVVDGVPRALPALQRAARLQEKASRVGFDWARTQDVAAKVREEVEEFLARIAAREADGGPAAAHADGGSSTAATGPLPAPEPAEALPPQPAETDARAADAAVREEFGDLLFALVNLSRFLGVRAEEALSAACEKFVRRFRAMERAARAQGRALESMTLAEMDALWDAAKRAEHA